MRDKMKDAMLHHVRAKNSFKSCVARCCPENRGKTSTLHRRSARRVLKQQIHFELDDLADEQRQKEIDDAKFWAGIAEDEDELVMEEFFRSRKEEMDDLLECLLLDEEFLQEREDIYEN
jgi:hypothetical protein